MICKETIGNVEDAQSKLVQRLATYYPSDLFQDLHLVDLEEFKYGGTNITSFRLVDPNNPEVKEVVRSWSVIKKESMISMNRTNFKVV